MYNKIIREFFIWGSNDDACLSVSIWAPLKPVEKNVPVIIFIYGGGGTTGGSTVPYQNPQKWVQRTQAHIVVSLQYRLNFFSSPNGPDDSSKSPNIGNAALSFYDARLALEWIRDNIANFGGDPKRMVLWGQSAGSRLTGQQSLGYPDDPIVTGYIQDSGPTWDVFGTQYTDTSHANWTFMAKQFNCYPAPEGATVESCMRAIPQADIEAFILFWVDEAKTPALSFQSKPDNITTFVNATVAYLSGHHAKLPKILAHNEV